LVNKTGIRVRPKQNIVRSFVLNKRPVKLAG
jgi:hypothetical protein